MSGSASATPAGKKKSPLSKLVTHGVLAFCTILTLSPLMIVLRIAFSPGNSGANKSLSPIPAEWSFDNFAAVVSTTSAQGEWLFGRQLLNSVVLSVATTILGIFLVAFFLKRVGGTAVFIAALVAQALILAIHFSDIRIAFLWYNLIAPAIVVVLAVGIQAMLPPTRTP